MNEDPVLSSGKLCKYFFTQMTVTVLVLIVFESQTTDPVFLQIENFLVYQCLILIADLLFFLFKSNKSSPSQLLDNDNNFESIN